MIGKYNPSPQPKPVQVWGPKDSGFIRRKGEFKDDEVEVGNKNVILLSILYFCNCISFRLFELPFTEYHSNH